MDLETFTYYDSVWSSDNQSPIYGFRIFKDTALRLPPCYVEKYDVRRFFEGFPKYCEQTFVTLPISCNGSTQRNVHNVTRRYTHAFLTSGPLGFSTDIAGYPEEEKTLLKEVVKKFKVDREFYITAEMRIIHDATDITAIQYSDKNLERVLVQIFTNTPLQESITVYPVVAKGSDNKLGEETLSAEEVISDGITVNIKDIDCVTLEFIKK